MAPARVVCRSHQRPSPSSQAKVVVCLVKILPAIAVPTWLWAWAAGIVLVKMANAISGFAVEGHLVMPHTAANKVVGLVVFLVPFAIPLVGVTTPAIIVCDIATFAAVQEGHFIRTGRSSASGSSYV